MNREAQILQALANSSLSMEARRALTDELHDVRAEAARRHEASRSIDFDAASAHLTPVQPHVHHTAETDWLGRVAAHGKTAQQIHAAAKAEASRWFTTIHPQIVADRTEFAIQATGKAHQWAGQWGDDFRSAVASFLQQAGHLSGFKVAECSDDDSGEDGEDGDSNGDAEKSNPPMSGEDGEVEDDDDYDGPRKESIRRRVGSMEDLPVYRFTANPSQYTPEDLAIALRDGYDDLGRGTDTDPDGNPYVWVEYRMDDSTARSWYDTIPGIGMSRRGARRRTATWTKTDQKGSFGAADVWQSSDPAIYAYVYRNSNSPRVRVFRSTPTGDAPGDGFIGVELVTLPLPSTRNIADFEIQNLLDQEAKLDSFTSSLRTAVSQEVAAASAFLGKLNEGDPVTVVIDGQEKQMSVSRRLSSGDPGGFGAMESSYVIVSFGPGRYATDITVRQQAAKSPGMPYIKDGVAATASKRTVGYINSYGLNDEGPTGMRRGDRVWIEGAVRATVLYVGFDDITNNLGINPEELGFKMYQDSYPVAVTTGDGVRIVQFDALSPRAVTASKRTASTTRDEKVRRTSARRTSGGAPSGETDDAAQTSQTPSTQEYTDESDFDVADDFDEGRYGSRRIGYAYFEDSSSAEGWLQYGCYGRATANKIAAAMKAAGMSAVTIEVNGVEMAETEYGDTQDDVFMIYGNVPAGVDFDSFTEKVRSLIEGSLGERLSSLHTAADDWWPLVPSTKYPGERDLVCPTCGSPDVSISGNNLGRDIITNNLYTSLTCNSCGRRDIFFKQPKSRYSSSRTAVSLPARANYLIRWLENNTTGKNDDDQVAELVDILQGLGLEWFYETDSNIKVVTKEQYAQAKASGDVRDALRDVADARTGSRRSAGYDESGACERCGHGAMYHGGSESAPCEYPKCGCSRFRKSKMSLRRRASDVPSPSADSQNGYGESSLPDVTVLGAPEDTNLGWIDDDPEGAYDQAPQGSVGPFDAAIRTAADGDTSFCRLCGKKLEQMEYAWYPLKASPMQRDVGQHYCVPARLTSGRPGEFGPDGVLVPGSPGGEGGQYDAPAGTIFDGGGNPIKIARSVSDRESSIITNTAGERFRLVGGSLVRVGEGMIVDPSDAPEDTNLGWIAEGDPNAQDEFAFEAPDFPIANEASLHVGQLRIEEGVGYASGNPIFTVQYMPDNEDSWSYGVWENVKTFLSRDDAERYIADHEAKFPKDSSLHQAMPNPVDLGIQVGDIFYSSWGYDQTNVDFYQVVGLTGASVKVRQIAQRTVRSGGPGGDSVVAVPDHFVGEVMTKRIQNYSDVPTFTLNSYSSAYLWDGTPKYQTGFGFGH